ncbi:MAG: amidase, partial [Ketobacter sp.]
MTATQLLRQLKTGEISSRALLEHYIARLEEKNKAINAV